jgi:hypothetical protein
MDRAGRAGPSSVEGPGVLRRVAHDGMTNMTGFGNNRYGRARRNLYVEKPIIPVMSSCPR